MDDTENRGKSRAPQLEDLISLCRSLNDVGAQYILIGGFAVILNGYVRATKDIDFLVEASPENIKKIKQAMSQLPDNAIREMQDDDVAKYTVVRIADEFVVDLLSKACGIDYEMAKNEVEIYKIEGIEIPVAKRELLIKTKDTVRPSDKTDVDFLKRDLAQRKVFT